MKNITLFLIFFFFYFFIALSSSAFCYSVYSPNSSDKWAMYTEREIRWQKTGSSTILIHLYQYGSFVQVINNTAPNTGSYSWKVFEWLSPGSGYTIEFWDGTNAIYFKSDSFSISNGVRVQEPNGGETFTIGDSCKITWDRFPSTSSGLSKVLIHLYKGSSVSKVISSSTDNDGTFYWTVNNVSSGSNYRIAVAGSSDGGISYDFSDSYFTIKEPEKPDLVVKNEDISSSNVYAGDDITVSADVKNSGDSSANPSRLRYYLSDNNSFSSNDLLLGSDYVKSLSSGSSSYESDTVSIPNNTNSGYWYILFKADADSEVSEKNEGNNVEYKQIKILPSKPSLNSPNNYSIYHRKKTRSITFKWNSVGGASSYRLCIFPEGQASNPKYNEWIGNTTSKSLTIENWNDGVYVWYVKAKSSAGEGQFSSAREFIADTPSAKPNFSAPSQNNFVAGSSTTFMWNKPNSTTHRYQFYIVNSANNAVASFPCIVEPTRSQSVSFSGKEWVPGTYVCWLEAMKKTPKPDLYNSTTYETTIGWSERYEAKRFQLKKPDKVTNLNITEINDGLQLSWDSANDISNPVYEIFWGTDDSVDLNNKAGVMSTPSSLFSHNPLDAGARYYYRVRACTDDSGSACGDLSDLASAVAPSVDLAIVLDNISQTANVQRGNTFSISATIEKVKGGYMRPETDTIEIDVYMNQSKTANEVNEEHRIPEASFSIPAASFDSATQITKKIDIPIPTTIEGFQYIHVQVDATEKWDNTNKTNNFSVTNSTIKVWRQGKPSTSSDLGLLARTHDVEKVFWINKHNVKFWIQNQELFNDLNYSDSDVQWYGSGVLNDDDFKMGKNVLNDNDQFCFRSSDESAVYVIENGESHPFFDWPNFLGQGFSQENIFWISPEGANWIFSKYHKVDAPMIRVSPENLKFK